MMNIRSEEGNENFKNRLNTVLSRIKQDKILGGFVQTSEQDFDKKRIYHQWPDNYCDLTGMNGGNFRNYAVMGTPTLYLLDKNGIVLKKSAMADEIIDQIK